MGEATEALRGAGVVVARPEHLAERRVSLGEVRRQGERAAGQLVGALEDLGLGPRVAVGLRFETREGRERRSVLGIARERIYATGFSAGGSFTMRLACDEADRFAAVGIVASTMDDDRAAGCQSGERITTALVVGTVDLLVPIDGDSATGRLSADATIALFARRNGCALAGRTVAYEPDLLDDGRRVRREAYEGCRDGTETVLWVVEVGNHSWYRGDVDTGLLLAALFLRHRH